MIVDRTHVSILIDMFNRFGSVWWRQTCLLTFWAQSTRFYLNKIAYFLDSAFFHATNVTDAK